MNEPFLFRSPKLEVFLFCSPPVAEAPPYEKGDFRQTALPAAFDFAVPCSRYDAASARDVTCLPEQSLSNYNVTCLLKAKLIHQQFQRDCSGTRVRVAKRDNATHDDIPLCRGNVLPAVWENRVKAQDRKLPVLSEAAAYRLPSLKPKEAEI